ncbi:MAG: MIP/aquaporin family protein [Phycisphaerales bacterium]
MRKLFAECVGTFFLVFFGAGAIIVNERSGGAITHPGISIVFGLVVMVMIFAFGGVSGAHMNPAVTAALAAARKFPSRDVVGYVAAQLIGATLASFCHTLIFPDAGTLGGTLPAGPWWQSFVLETILTFALVMVVLASEHRERSAPSTAVAVGGLIALEALFAGPVSGASMNPARSLGPAIASMNPQWLWMYLVAPTLGALLAAAASRLIFVAPPVVADPE